MKLKTKELYPILNSLETLKARQDLGLKCSYVVAKNIKNIESEIKLIETGKTQFLESDEWKAFQKERDELIIKFSKKDDKGQPIYNADEKSVQIENIKEFQVEFNKLVEKNNELFEKEQKINKEMNELIQKEIDFDFVTISIDDIKADLTPEIIQPLIDFIVIG